MLFSSRTCFKFLSNIPELRVINPLIKSISIILFNFAVERYIRFSSCFFEVSLNEPEPVIKILKL